MKRIAQIVPYFGKWPEWIKLYLYSCSRNKIIDFIFYTDCDISGLPKYDNIRYIKMSLHEYSDLVSERLYIDYRISNAYKLTDLRPFLGAIHKEELKEYDFWSFGDIDLCYGDLSMVLNDNNLDNYDLITTHCYHIAGHLTIIKNNEYYRNLCFRISDWKNKITDDKHYVLDEGEWSSLVYPGLYWGRILWKYLVRRLKVTDFYSFLNMYNKKFNRRQLFTEFFTSPAPKIHQKWKYDVNTGIVTGPDEIEVPYLHFLFFKKTPWFEADLYWRPGFYHITKPIADYSTVEFSLLGIYGKSNE